MCVCTQAQRKGVGLQQPRPGLAREATAPMLCGGSTGASSPTLSSCLPLAGFDVEMFREAASLVGWEEGVNYNWKCWTDWDGKWGWGWEMGRWCVMWVFVSS